ncbi:MAG: HAMP domain-containing protein [Parabacteroides distasonis]|nr:HAMP domain-containing protein [Parabacteroides distasonis]
MKLKQINLLRSFSTRLSLFIFLVSASVFIITFVAYYGSARSEVEEEAAKHAQSTVSNAILKIEDLLNSVEVAIKNTAWIIPKHLDDPNYMYGATQVLLKNNPFIFGSSIAFEPSFYPEKGVMYAPYSYREGDSIKSKQLGTEDYDYHYYDWYQIPKLLKKTYWSEPYYDEGGGDMMMTTYSYPLYDDKGNIYAVFTADVSLEWLAEFVKSIKLYPNSYNMMLGRGGTYIVHRDKERILNETIFTATLDMEDRTIEEIGHGMIEGKTAMHSLQNDSLLSYVFYAPIKSTGWSVAVVCPYSDVFSGVDEMKHVVLFITTIGLLLLVAFVYYTIKHLTAPLTTFSQAAIQIAEGNFEAALPDIQSEDEMRSLRDSFAFMQKSLVAYIEELKFTTANKERIESELRIASEIQMGMVPKLFPPFPERTDIDLYATLKPAKEVGGDLYDFFMKDNKLYFIIGDVSGKGVPASLIMAVVCRLFRTEAAHFDEPAAIVSCLNNSLAETNESNMFVTCFLGILDISSGKLRYCNAGHNAPVLLTRRNDVFYMNVKPNLPLGLFADFPYEGEETLLDKKSTLFMYTDGVTEAENVKSELFSEERLLDLLKSSQKKKANELIGLILEEVHAYAGEKEQSDDITMLCIILNLDGDNKI